MRDSEFKEMLQAFEISSSLNAKDHVAEDKVSFPYLAMSQMASYQKHQLTFSACASVSFSKLS